uniref:Isoamyl acetate-hydrolyzing esterase 1 homolog n=1 Tax=Felis catus TaxID=9685 RepID=A0ABI7VQU5_FELCA
MNERTGSEGTRPSSGKRTQMSVRRATATARLNNDWSVAKGAWPQDPGVWRAATPTDNRRATNCAGSSFHHHHHPSPARNPAQAPLAPPPARSPRPDIRPRPAPLPAGNMALCEAAGSLYWPRVLLFGDSITQFSFQQGGWGASLADKLVRKCDVLNRGFSGYNTRWAKIILPRLIKKGTGLDSPVAVTIFFGANDSALKDENPKQHVPLDEYVANLKSMVRYLKSVDVPEHRIVLISPPPLCEAAWERECLAQGCKLNRLNLVVGEYADACLQVARACGTDVLDLWTLMQKDGQPESVFTTRNGESGSPRSSPAPEEGAGAFRTVVSTGPGSPALPSRSQPCASASLQSRA